MNFSLKYIQEQLLIFQKKSQFSHDFELNQRSASKIQLFLSNVEFKTRVGMLLYIFGVNSYQIDTGIAFVSNKQILV